MLNANPSASGKFFSLFTLSLVHLRNGDKLSEPLQRHFNEVVSQAREIHNDPDFILNNSNLLPQAHRLAAIMYNKDKLKKQILRVDSYLDVDSETANSILAELEPLYACTN